MRLARLKLVNFRQHRDTTIEFSDGLTGLIGPNGAGKTTLLEGIAWALYGTAAVRGTRDSIRWRRATPRSEVRAELEFTLGAHEYRVVRTLFNAELYVDRGSKPAATSLNEVTARITRTLRMGYDEFFRTYFTGQKELAAMAALKPTDRRHFLNRLLGYDRLRNAQEKVRTRKSAMGGELSGLQLGGPAPDALVAAREKAAREHEAATARLAAAQESLERSRSASDQHLPVFHGLKAFRERHAALSADRRVAEAELRDAVDAIPRLTEQHGEASTAGEELKALAPVVERWQQAKAALAELEALQKDADTRARCETRLAEVERRLASATIQRAETAARAALMPEHDRKLKAARADAEAAEQAYRDAHAAWERDKADAAATRRHKLDQFTDLEQQRKRIVGAGAEGACPTCGRPLGAEYAGVISLLDAQLEDVKQSGTYFRSRIEQLKGVPEELAKLDQLRHEVAHGLEALANEVALAKRAAVETAGLDRELAALDERQQSITAEVAALRPGYDRAAHDDVLKSVAELEPDVRRAERLTTLAERAEALAAELAAAEARRAARVERLAGIQRELDELAYSEEQFLNAEREMDRLENTWREAEREVLQAQADAGTAADRLSEAERAEREAAARIARLAELQKDIRLHLELDRAFGDLGVELNAEIGPEISAIASDLLADLTDGRFDEVTLDEQFDATVLEAGEERPVVSGGEEDMLHLVLRLAVSQMIADRAGQPLSLLVLDEIFGSLDEAHRAGVMRLLRGLAGRFPQVVLISHVEGVRDSLDRVLKVEYDDEKGYATVSEERPLIDTTGGAGANVAA